MSLRKAGPRATALTMDSRGINLSQVHRNTLCWLHPPLPDPTLELLPHLNTQSQEDSHSALSHSESFLGWAPLAIVLTQLEWLEASCSVSLTHTCPLCPWLLLPNPGRKGWVVYPRASRDKATCAWANSKTFLNLTHNDKNVFRCKLTKTHFYILISLFFKKREREKERKEKERQKYVLASLELKHLTRLSSLHDFVIPLL